MKGVSLLAVTLLILVGCSKGGDPATTTSDPAAKSGSTTATGNSAPQSNFGLSTGATQTPSKSAQPNPPGTYSFQFAPQVGKLSYKTSRKVDSGDGKPQETSNTLTTTTSKNPDGTFTIVSDGTSVGGMPPVMTKQVVDAEGKVIKATTDTGGGEHPVPNSSTITSSFPDHAVKIGESWTKTQKVAEGTIVSVYKLVSVDGDLATVGVTRDSKTPKVTSAGTIKIELKTCTPHSITLDVLASNVPGGKGPHTVKIHTDMQMQ